MAAAGLDAAAACRRLDPAVRARAGPVSPAVLRRDQRIGHRGGAGAGQRRQGARAARAVRLQRFRILHRCAAPSAPVPAVPGVAGGAAAGVRVRPGVVGRTGAGVLGYRGAHGGLGRPCCAGPVLGRHAGAGGCRRGAGCAGRPPRRRADLRGGSGLAAPGSGGHPVAVWKGRAPALDARHAIRSVRRGARGGRRRPAAAPGQRAERVILRRAARVPGRSSPRCWPAWMRCAPRPWARPARGGGLGRQYGAHRIRLPDRAGRVGAGRAPLQPVPAPAPAAAQPGQPSAPARLPHGVRASLPRQLLRP